MPSNKDRLYITLYARGGGAIMPSKEDTYTISISYYTIPTNN